MHDRLGLRRTFGLRGCWKITVVGFDELAIVVVVPTVAAVSFVAAADEKLVFGSNGVAGCDSLNLFLAS